MALIHSVTTVIDNIYTKILKNLLILILSKIYVFCCLWYYFERSIVNKRYKKEDGRAKKK